MLERPITSLILEGSILTARRTDTEGRPSIFLSVIGRPEDDRSLWSVRASEERYRKLIQYLPIPLLQVDAREIGGVFSELKLEGIADLGPHLDLHADLIDFANASVRITKANQAAVALFGADDAAALTGPVAKVFAASPETARRVMIARFKGQRTYAEVMKMRTLDGRLLDVRITITYPAPPERLDVTLICLEDLTDQRSTEYQLRQLQAEFARAARILTLGQLATSIAHEVNQPLSAIATNAETSLRWLSRDEPNLEKIGQLTARVAASAHHASEIVQRIRGTAAKHMPDRISLDLNDIVEEEIGRAHV